MEDLLVAIGKWLLTQGAVGVAALCLGGFAAYQTWRLLRIEADRDRDRAVWVQEAAARQTAFAAVTAALTELKVLAASTLELMRQRGRR